MIFTGSIETSLFSVSSFLNLRRATFFSNETGFFFRGFRAAFLFEASFSASVATAVKNFAASIISLRGRGYDSFTYSSFDSMIAIQSAARCLKYSAIFEACIGFTSFSTIQVYGTNSSPLCLCQTSSNLPSSSMMNVSVLAATRS